MFKRNQKIESAKAVPALRVLDDNEVVAVSGGTGASPSPPPLTVGIGMGKGMYDVASPTPTPTPAPTTGLPTGQRMHKPM